MQYPYPELKPENLLDAVRILGQSMVASPSGEPPFEGGNYFDVRTADGRGFAIVNFVLENLQHLLVVGLEWPVKIAVLESHFAVIHDDRIPDRWYKKGFGACPERLMPRDQVAALMRQRSYEVLSEVDGRKIYRANRRPTLGDVDPPPSQATLITFKATEQVGTTIANQQAVTRVVEDGKGKQYLIVDPPPYQHIKYVPLDYFGDKVTRTAVAITGKAELWQGAWCVKIETSAPFPVDTDFTHHYVEEPVWQTWQATPVLATRVVAEQGKWMAAKFVGGCDWGSSDVDQVKQAAIRATEGDEPGRAQLLDFIDGVLGKPTDDAVKLAMFSEQAPSKSPVQTEGDLKYIVEAEGLNLPEPTSIPAIIDTIKGIKTARTDAMLAKQREWKRIQELPAVNDTQPLSEVKVGDIVRVTPERSFYYAGNSKCIEVTEDVIILQNGHAYDRKTGVTVIGPSAYYLDQPAQPKGETDDKTT